MNVIKHFLTLSSCTIFCINSVYSVDTYDVLNQRELHIIESATDWSEYFSSSADSLTQYLERYLSFIEQCEQEEAPSTPLPLSANEALRVKLPQWVFWAITSSPNINIIRQDNDYFVTHENNNKTIHYLLLPHDHGLWIQNNKLFGYNRNGDIFSIAENGFRQIKTPLRLCR